MPGRISRFAASQRVGRLAIGGMLLADLRRAEHVLAEALERMQPRPTSTLRWRPRSW
jgi:hypothetical protein